MGGNSDHYLLLYFVVSTTSQDLVDASMQCFVKVEKLRRLHTTIS